MTNQIRLSTERQTDICDRLRLLFRDEFDEDLSDFRAEQILDFMVRTLGPMVYNQAVQDVRGHLQIRLDDLEGEVYVDTITLD